jgi:hypothetical protein
MKENLGNFVTVEEWKDLKIRETLNIVDCAMFRDKTRPDDIADIRNTLKGNPS